MCNVLELLGRKKKFKEYQCGVTRSYDGQDDSIVYTFIVPSWLLTINDGGFKHLLSVTCYCSCSCLIECVDFDEDSRYDEQRQETKTIKKVNNSIQQF